MLGVQSDRPQAGARQAPTDLNAYLPIAVGPTRRGPTKWAVKLVNQRRDFRKHFGGRWGDSPLAYAAADFARLGVMRLEGSGARRGSRRVLNYLDGSAFLMVGFSSGSYGSEVDGVPGRDGKVKWQTVTITSTNNVPGTLTNATTVIGLTSLRGVEVGDSFYAVDSTGNRAAGVVVAINPTTSEVSLFTKAGWVTGTVALGGTIGSSTYHGASTKSTATLPTGATSLLLQSTRGFKKGDDVVVIHQSAPTANEPVGLTITGVTNEGISFAAYAGATTFPIGSIVVSLETYATLTEQNADDESYVEELGPLSMSDTAKGKYLADVAGTSLSFVIGSAMAETVGAQINSNATSITVSSGAAFTIGNWYKFGTGLVAQVKDKNGAVLYVDNIGVLAAPIAVAASIFPATPTFTEARESKSTLVLLQEAVASGPGEDTSIPVYLRYPRPVAFGAMTGGADGSTATGPSAVLGSSTPGAKTGLYALDEAEWVRGEGIAIVVPGIDDTSASSRALIDQTVAPWARERKLHFLSSTPSDITSVSGFSSYRLQTLGLDEEDTSLLFPGRLYVASYADGAPSVEMSPDMAELWKFVRVVERFGIEEPAAGPDPRKAYPTWVRGVKNAPTLDEAQEIDNNGGNPILVGSDGRPYSMGVNTLYRARKDGSKLHMWNASMTQKLIVKSVQAYLAEGQITVQNVAELEDIQDAVNEYLANQPARRFERAGSFALMGDVTTPPADFATGLGNLELHLMLAGALKAIKIKPFLYTGSIRLERVAA